MSNLLQVAIPVAIPAVVAVLVAYQGAISRTGRLRRNVKADVELLAGLPADHPSRPAMEGHVGELVDELIRREHWRYFSAAGRGSNFRSTRALAAVAAAGAISLALWAVRGGGPGLSEGIAWWTAAAYGGIAVLAAGRAFWIWRRRDAEERAAAALRTAGDGRSGGPAGPFYPPPTRQRAPSVLSR